MFIFTLFLSCVIILKITIDSQPQDQSYVMGHNFHNYANMYHLTITSEPVLDWL